MNILSTFFKVSICLIVLSCSSTDKSKSITDSKDTLKNKNSIQESSEPQSKWIYDERLDKMTSKKTFLAMIEANELLEFDFPYNGGSTATIQIREKEKDLDIMLFVSKGQFTGGIDGGTVRLRFDNEDPMKISYAMSSDGSSDVIFLNNEAKLLKKLKKSSKLLIEAEFFNEGYKQMEFDVKGFEWNH